MSYTEASSPSSWPLNQGLLQGHLLQAMSLWIPRSAFVIHDAEVFKSTGQLFHEMFLNLSLFAASSWFKSGYVTVPGWNILRVISATASDT